MRLIETFTLKQNKTPKIHFLRVTQVYLRGNVAVKNKRKEETQAKVRKRSISE